MFVLVDYYSRWSNVAIMKKKPETCDIVSPMRHMFATPGLEKMIVSDNCSNLCSAGMENVICRIMALGIGESLQQLEVERKR